MTKTLLLGLRDTRLRTCRGGTLEANLPVSRPTSSPQCTIACGTIQPLAHVLGVECSTPTAGPPWPSLETPARMYCGGDFVARLLGDFSGG